MCDLVHKGVSYEVAYDRDVFYTLWKYLICGVIRQAKKRSYFVGLTFEVPLALAWRCALSSRTQAPYLSAAYCADAGESRYRYEYSQLPSR